MAETHRYSVSAAAVVVRQDGRVLAIKRRDNGHWEPPGGVLDPGERIEDALKREVKEETGLAVEPQALAGVYQNMRQDIVSFVFRCTTVDETALRTTDEAADFGWLDRQEIQSLVDEAYAVRLLDALDYRESVKIRAHDGVSVL